MFDLEDVVRQYEKEGWNLLTKKSIFYRTQGYCSEHEYYNMHVFFINFSNKPETGWELQGVYSHLTALQLFNLLLEGV